VQALDSLAVRLPTAVLLVLIAGFKRRWAFFQAVNDPDVQTFLFYRGARADAYCHELGGQLAVPAELFDARRRVGAAAGSLQ
jgi:hypothetical protein